MQDGGEDIECNKLLIKHRVLDFDCRDLSSGDYSN